MSGDFDLHIDLDGDEELRRAFEVAPRTMSTAILKAVDESSAALQRDWRSGARRSSGTHGPHYPTSITHDVTIEDGAVTGDVGPERGKLQGRMGPGFEYGSVHQPPHMDGASAFAGNTQKFEQAIQGAIDDVIGRIG
jgi:hypothetical protein